MKTNIRKIALMLIMVSMPLFFVQCDNSKEKSAGKEDNAQQQAVAQKEIKPQKQAPPTKYKLPEKLLNLGLTDDQRAQCEAAYQEIFTPDILAQRKEMKKQLKGLAENSEQYLNLKKEINEKFKPYYAQFRVKLKEILTPEQQKQYFAKKQK